MNTTLTIVAVTIIAILSTCVLFLYHRNKELESRALNAESDLTEAQSKIWASQILIDILTSDDHE